MGQTKDRFIAHGQRFISHTRSRRRGAVAGLLVAALAAAGAAAGAGVPSLGASASSAEVPLVVVPCAPSDPQARVLIARRVLVQMPSGGGPSAATIPSWAGQWVAVAGSASGTTPLQAASRLFAAQTGQALPGLASATSTSDSTDFELTRYVVVPMSEDALESLAAAAASAIAAGTPPQRVLATAEAMPVAQALSLIGPIPAPADGWPELVIETVYGGVAPSPLDVVFPTLVTQLGVRSQQTGEEFRQALLLAAQACGAPPSP